jgi:hypothetical protein
LLTSVEIRTQQGELLTLPLDDISNGIVVEEIEGLDPVKAILVSSNFAHSDGEEFHTARRMPRNIKMRLGLEPDYVTENVRDIRKRLYNFFMPKSPTSLRFVLSDSSNVDIVGIVETFETALFTKEPVVDISMMCFDPDFYDPTPAVISGTTTDLTTETLVEYEGTVETGFLLTLSPDRSIDEFTVYLRPPDDTLRTLEFSYPLLAGDTLEISTRVGQKGAWLTRGGVRTSALYGVSPQSNWLEFQPGDNHIRVYAEGAGIPYEIEYTTKYGGL